MRKKNYIDYIHISKNTDGAYQLNV